MLQNWAMATAITTCARNTTHTHKHTCSCSEWRPAQPLLPRCAYGQHMHATGTHQSWPVFKRQPEKKDALLMRRSGPCSEKARRGLQSWENPAQQKQNKKKHGKEEREKTWTTVSEWTRRKAGNLLLSGHPVLNYLVTVALTSLGQIDQSARQTSRLASLTENSWSNCSITGCRYLISLQTAQFPFFCEHVRKKYRRG